MDLVTWLETAHVKSYCYGQSSSHCLKLQFSKNNPTNASDNLQFLDDPISVQHNCTHVDNRENHKQNWICRP